MMEKEPPKSIFIGGVGRSGTTLTMQLLDKCHQIAAIGEMKLIDDTIFRNFPEWIYTCPPAHRRTLLDIFKRLCLTRFYRHRALWQVPWLVRFPWQRFNALWLARFQRPWSLMWRNLIWATVERIWLSAPVQGCTLGMKMADTPVAQVSQGFRGMFGHFSQADIYQNFVLLDSLGEGVLTAEQAYRMYGAFWSAVFSTYACRKGKPYWAEKTPSNGLHLPFLFRCFEGMKFVNVIRDGRDVACSNIEQKWGEQDLKNALDVWAHHLTKTLNDQQELPDDCYINIRYEDLVLSTRSTLQRLTDFLGVDFDAAILSYPIRSDSIGRYRDVWTPMLEAYALEHHAALLKQWGYEI